MPGASRICGRRIEGGWGDADDECWVLLVGVCIFNVSSSDFGGG